MIYNENDWQDPDDYSPGGPINPWHALIFLLAAIILIATLLNVFS